MPFEHVNIKLPNGQLYGPTDWRTFTQWVREGRIPSEATLVDVATGQSRLVSSIPGLTTDDQPDVVSTVIPYKNPKALTAYYLGLFSLLACAPVVGVVGIGMGIAAVNLGLKGLKAVKQDPKLKGSVHAWIGVVGGSICAICGVVMQGIVAWAILSSLR